MTDRPSIVAFSGHMTDAPDRAKPRFPESHVAEVRERVRGVLQNLRGPLFGVSSAARGGDLVFIRSVLELGGSSIVLLPFPPADFKRTSVGQGWDPEFDELIYSKRVDLRPPLRAVCPSDADAQNAAFAECNDQIVDVAAKLAQTHGVTDALFLALYKQTGADALGGTMDAFERWRKTGGRLEIIEP